MQRHFRFIHRGFLFALLMALAAVFIPCSFTAAEAEKETPPAVKPAVTPVSTGVIRTIDGKRYLYDAATETPVKGKSGIVEFPAGSGDRYFLKNASGEVFVKCWIKSGGKVYRAAADGKMPSGIAQVGTKNYYFNPKTLARGKQGWKTTEDGKIYVNANGIVQSGFLTLKKYTFYLDPDDGYARATGWQKISGKNYFFNDKGRMQKGIVFIDGFRYYFDSKGIRRTGLKTINGSRYFFDKSKNGAMATGWITKGTKKYYFAPSTGKAVTGWLTLNDKKYYFNSLGVMQKGWLTYDGKKYYLSTSTGAMLTGKHKIDGKTYDFGKNGYLAEATGPYSIKVNLGTCVVTIYRGSTAVKAMLCSPGLNNATPTGTFSLGIKRHWHALFGGVYGQYTSLITGNILFHSVYYYRYKDNNSLATAQYNKLGSPASSGCVRLNCADAYYIFTNCPVGTPVTIFRGSTTDDPLPRPSKLTISTSYDPTDPITND